MVCVGRGRLGVLSVWGRGKVSHGILQCSTVIREPVPTPQQWTAAALHGLAPGATPLQSLSCNTQSRQLGPTQRSSSPPHNIHNFSQQLVLQLFSKRWFATRSDCRAVGLKT